MAQDFGQGREQLHPGGDASDPEVDRYLPRPVRLLYRRYAIVVLVLPPGIGLGVVGGLDLPVLLLPRLLRDICHPSLLSSPGRRRRQQRPGPQQRWRSSPKPLSPSPAARTGARGGYTSPARPGG